MHSFREYLLGAFSKDGSRPIVVQTRELTQIVFYYKDLIQLMNMATNPELMRAEESVKQEYLECVKNLSHIELKKFNKNEYAELVFQDLHKLLPDFETSQLRETAHYVSNALNNEAKHQLMKKSRNVTTAKDNNSALLSSTVLEDLDKTTLLDAESVNSIDKVETQTDSNSTVCEPTDPLNDSITQLKQRVQNEKATQNNSESNTMKGQKGTKCGDSCKLNQKTKKNIDMIQCSFCMSWYHDLCMGIKKDEPVGIWLCPNCRTVPQDVRNEIDSLKTEVKQLKTTTNLILSSINSLSDKLDNCVGGINDRITALKRHINQHDITITEEIENVSSKTSNLKSSLDQKTSQILNKTTAVFEKMKTYEQSTKENMSKQDQKPNEEKLVDSRNQKPTQNKTPSGLNSMQPKRQDKQRQIQTEPQCVTKNNRQNRQIKQHKQIQSRASSQIVHENDIIDLTKTVSSRNTIKQSTLLIGSSVLKNIKVSELNKNTAIRTIPGATIAKLTDKINELNIENCETIILHVGGNDADNGEDIESFREHYESLIDTVNDGNRRIIVSGLLPRESVDLEPYNETLKSLCADNTVELVDNYDSFLLATGELVDSYYSKDKVHINMTGTRKLLENINKVHKVCNMQRAHRQHTDHNNFRQRQTTFRGNSQSSKYCHICCRNGNHSTYECWYNGRNERLATRRSR